MCNGKTKIIITRTVNAHAWLNRKYEYMESCVLKNANRSMKNFVFLRIQHTSLLCIYNYEVQCGI